MTDRLLTLLDPGNPEPLARLLGVILIVALAAATYPLTGGLLTRLIRRFVTRTRFDWDNTLLNEAMLRTIARLLPALILRMGAATMFPFRDAPRLFVERAATVWIILLGMMALTNLAWSGEKIYNRFPASRSRPARGLLQLILIFLYAIGVILIVSTVVDRPAWGFLTGLGAISAVLLLVFKDALLGLVASFQISANNMVRIGDWIEMPKYQADGDVIEISLQSVKVQNWDRTITSIPIYALVGDSFINWRGMSESGGRRIARSIHLDLKSIRFCTPAMIERFRRIRCLHDYIEAKEAEIREHNAARGIDENEPVNGRRMTNIGTFRAYVQQYLRQHPGVRQDMILMVRQLAPTERGLALQIYAFSADTVWVNYEALQADIFDHLLAVVPEFGLRVFQEPSGWDFERFAAAGAARPDEAPSPESADEC